MSAPYLYTPAAATDGTVSDPRAAYQTRIDAMAVLGTKLTRRDLRFVRFRVAIFVMAVGLAILCFGDPDYVSWWWISIPALLFFSLLTTEWVVRKLNGLP